LLLLAFNSASFLALAAFLANLACLDSSSSLLKISALSSSFLTLATALEAPPADFVFPLSPMALSASATVSSSSAS
jgi:hypothetical protein